MPKLGYEVKLRESIRKLEASLPLNDFQEKLDSLYETAIREFVNDKTVKPSKKIESTKNNRKYKYPTFVNVI